MKTDVQKVEELIRYLENSKQTTAKINAKINEIINQTRCPIGDRSKESCRTVDIEKSALEYRITNAHKNIAKGKEEENDWLIEFGRKELRAARIQLTRLKRSDAYTLYKQNPKLFEKLVSRQILLECEHDVTINLHKDFMKPRVKNIIQAARLALKSKSPEALAALAKAADKFYDRIQNNSEGPLLKELKEVTENILPKNTGQQQQARASASSDAGKRTVRPGGARPSKRQKTK